jgi:hypothetical protein
MSDKDKKVVAADLSFLTQIQAAPVGRRGGDSTSERGKVREFFFAKVLDPMVAHGVKEIELTDVIISMRQLALEKDGKTQITIPVDGKLGAGQRWFFLANVTATDERYRGLRNYLSGILKSRKEFFTEKKFSQRHGKDLVFIIQKEVKKAVVAKA